MCTRCVMERTDPNVEFDDHGLCELCVGYDALVAQGVFDERNCERELASIVSAMKKAGKNSRYDCVLGLSGGFDSSYAAFVAMKQLGLRPLAVHLDNGWNSELAVKN